MKAPIVIFMGTSSAGKTRFCEALAKMNADKFAVKVDGLDILSEEIGSPSQVFGRILASNPESKKIYEQLMENPEIFANGVIDKSVYSGRIIGETDKYSDSQKEALQKLIVAHHQEFNDKFPDGAKRVAMLGQRALENARNGIVTVLDVFPVDPARGIDVVGEFQKYVQQQDPSCQTLALTAHCDFEKIHKHMDLRNESGIAKEARKDLNPFEQYARLFVASDDAQNSVGSLTVGDVRSAVEKYGKDPVVDEKKLLQSLGATAELPDDKVIMMRPRNAAMAVVQTDSARGKVVDPSVIESSARQVSDLIRSAIVKNVGDKKEHRDQGHFTAQVLQNDQNKSLGGASKTQH